MTIWHIKAGHTAGRERAGQGARSFERSGSDVFDARCVWLLRWWLPVGIGLALLGGCAGGGDATSGRPAVLRLATTTSTRDSGLLEELLPSFETACDCRVDVIAVGTGAALKLGESGDVDVLLVHAREAEEAFMRAGHGIRHEEFMWNHFVLLGPPDDPAGIRGERLTAAMRRLAAAPHRFVSRGDDSGTHMRERMLWDRAGVRPEGGEYLESGQGMGPTLVVADEKRAYVLSDMGTYLKFRRQVELVPMVTSAESLRNPYAAIVVHPEKHARVDSERADRFVDFLISETAQRRIGDFRIGGRQLFYPTRLADP